MTTHARPKPLELPLKGDEGRDYLEKKLKPAFERGEIVEFIRESDRLVGEGETPEADAVIAYIRKVMDRLSIGATGQPCPPYDVYLSDLEGVRASVSTDGPKPILFIGLGLLDLLHENGMGEDHLAAVLGHERFHIRRHNTWQDLHNSRPEETVADIYGIMEAERAGYNPQAMGAFFRFIREKYRNTHTHRSSLGMLLDVHPDTDDRIRNSEVAMASLQLRKRMVDGMTPLPDAVMAAAGRVRFKTAFEKLATHTGYAAADPAGQLAILTRFYDSALARKDPYVRALSLAQSFDTSKALRQYAPTLAPQARRTLLGFMTRSEDDAGNSNRTRRRRYRWNDRNWKMDEEAYAFVLHRMCEFASGLVPEEERERHWLFDRDDQSRMDYRVKYKEILPREFLRLQTDSAAFWDAQTREDALTAARRYVAAQQVLARFSPGFKVFPYDRKTVEWPSRGHILDALKKDGFMEFEWSRHLRWAKGEGAANPETAEAENRLIASVASNLGCEDPRFGVREHFHMNRDWRNYHFDDLVFDDAGRVVELPRTQRDIEEEARERFKAKTAAELVAREYDVQVARVVKEKAEVAAADWPALANDFWGFVKKHASALTPERTVIPTEYPFATAFMRHVRALHKKDPAKWTPYLNEFFDGTDKGTYKSEEPEAQKNRYEDDDERKPRNPYTLPSLAAAHDRLYGIFNNDAVMRMKRGELPQSHPLSAYLGGLQRFIYRDHDMIYDEETETLKRVKRRIKSRPKKSQEVYLVQVCGADHPYVAGMIAFQTAAVKEKDAKIRRANRLDNNPLAVRRADLMLRHRYKNAMATGMDGFFTIDPYRFIGLKRPRGIADINRISANLVGRNSWGSHRIWREEEENVLLRILEANLAHKNPRRMPVSDLSFFDVTATFEHFGNERLAARLARRLKQAVDKQVLVNLHHDTAPDVALSRMISKFLHDSAVKDTEYKRHIQKNSRYWYGENRRGHNVFSTRPDIKQAYLDTIRDRVLALPPEERARPLLRLMQAPLDNPLYRDWACNEWTRSMLVRLGRDDGSAAYLKTLSQECGFAIDIMTPAQGLACTTRLLDATEAQKEAAFAVRDKLAEHYGREFLKKDGLMRIVESAIATCSGRSRLRQAFLEYTTNPLSEDGTAAFIHVLKNHAPESDLTKMIFDPEKRLMMTPIQEIMVMDGLHRNFWALPFELRTIHLDRILFPTHVNGDDAFNASITYVLDKVLPVERRFAPEAREALLVYLDCCPPELRRVTFSALLATVDHGQGEAMRPGQVLSHVLTRTGAAGGQILQAAHSYLSGISIADPELARFRDDLKSSKVDFSRPQRWEIFERMDEALPESEREQTGRIGAVLGCGSTAYVVEAGEGAARSALKLMRKDVAPIADLQFERYHAAFAKLAATRDIYRPLPGMVDHARELIKVSTDGRAAADQVRYAEGIYNGLEVAVGGRTVSFAVAPVISCGPEYLRTALVEGAHLNDLQAGEGRTRDLSLGIEAAEIHHMLQGRAIDQDRHGGQQKIGESDAVGMFDVGGIPYDSAKGAVLVPAAHEKRALGRLLGMMVNAVARGTSPVEALIHGVTDYKWGSAAPYLVGIKRAMLARMDVQNGFDGNVAERTRLHADLFRAVFTQTRVDADILSGMADTVSVAAMRGMMAPKATDGMLAVSIRDPLAQGTPRTAAEYAAIAARAGIRRIFAGAGIGKKPVEAAPRGGQGLSRRSVLTLHWKG